MKFFYGVLCPAYQLKINFRTKDSQIWLHEIQWPNEESDKLDVIYKDHVKFN